MREIKRIFGKILFVLIAAAAIGGVAAMTINNHVVNSTKDDIVFALNEETPQVLNREAKELAEREADAVMVLGCGIKDNETPTPMLKDRLDAGIALYRAGAAPKILLTGDNGSAGHNEIHVMLNYTKDAGVPEEDIFCDHAGFSTYDSVHRAREIFDVDRLIVVTQTYHEYRSLYICKELGIDAVGVGADQEVYAGQPMREMREILARVKDFFKAKSEPESTLGGEVIPISGSGLTSHGE